MMSRFGQCLLYLLICVAVLESATPKYSPDKKDWVDPGDMLSYDSATKTMRPRAKLGARPVPADPTGVEKFGREEEPPAGSLQIKLTQSLANCHLHNLFQVRDTMSCASPQKCDCPPCPKDTADTSKDKLTCHKCDMKFVRRFAQRLLNHFLYEKSEMTDELTFDVKMSLTKDELVILETFVITDFNGAIHEVDDIFSRLIQGVKLRRQGDVDFEDIRPPVIWNFFTNNVGVLLLAAGILLVAIIWTRLSTTKGYLILSALIVFFVSCGYEWMHLHQKLKAEKFAERSQFQDIPIECDPSRTSFFTKMWNDLRGDDRCKAYYQSMMVDSFYEINPMMAVTSMIGRLFEMLSKSMGVSIGSFYQNAISQFVWYSPFRYIMFVVLTVFFLVTIAAVMYYCIWMPRRPHFHHIAADPIQPSINAMHYRDAIHDVAANHQPSQNRLDHGNSSTPSHHHQQSVRTRPVRSAAIMTPQRRLEPVREHHQMSPPQPPSGTNYYCIRRQSPTVPSDSPRGPDEVYYVSGEIPHGECECRLAGEAGVHVMADSADHLVGADGGGGATTWQQTEQAEKIALIVSRLADELERTIISRRDGVAAVAGKSEETRPTVAGGEDSKLSECTSSSEQSTQNSASGDAGKTEATGGALPGDKSSADVGSQ